MSRKYSDNSEIQKYTKLLNDSKKFLENIDFCSNENIISEKMIFAKKGLFIKDFDPKYTFFCEGNSCIQGNLEVRGKLISKNNEDENEKNIISVNLNEKNPSGFAINNKNQSYGLFFNGLENSFTIGESRENKIFNNQTLKVNSLETFNIFSKNMVIDSSILSSNNDGKIILDCKKLKIKGSIESDDLLMDCQNLLINSDVKISKNLHVRECFYSDKIDVNNDINCQKIRSSSLIVENINCLNNLNSSNINIDYDLNVKNNAVINGILHINNEIKFNSTIKVPFQFDTITQIPNLSCEYINNKKVSKNGEIITSDERQILKNKSFDDSLDMGYNQIKKLSEPVESDDAVNKNYVDKFVFGLNFIEQVRVSSVSKMDGSFLNHTKQIISNKPEQLTIDNILLNINDRILIKDQENKTENGIYKVIAAGNRRQQWIIQMEEDYIEIIQNNNRENNILWIEEGERNQNSLYIFKNNYKFIKFADKKVLSDYINISSTNILKSISYLKKKMERIEKIYSV